MTRYVNQAEKVSISLPSSMLEIIEHLTDERGYSRSGFIRKAIENQLLVELKTKQTLEELYHTVFGK